MTSKTPLLAVVLGIFLSTFSTSLFAWTLVQNDVVGSEGDSQVFFTLIYTQADLVPSFCTVDAPPRSPGSRGPTRSMGAPARGSAENWGFEFDFDLISGSVPAAATWGTAGSGGDVVLTIGFQDVGITDFPPPFSGSGVYCFTDAEYNSIPIGTEFVRDSDFWFNLQSDSLEEETETGTVEITSCGGGLRGSCSSRTIDIIIEDATGSTEPPVDPPVDPPEDDLLVSIERVSDGAEPMTNGQFRVFTNQFVRDGELIVLLTSPGGTADEGIDYNRLPRSVVIRENTNTETITVEVIDNDDEPEDTESVTLGIRSSSDYGIGSGSASLDILDGGNTISIASNGDVNEPMSPGGFTVTLSEPLDFPVTVNYTVGGTAIAGTDFEAFSGPLTIPANSMTGSINFVVINDDIEEETKNVSVQIMAPEGFSLMGDGFASVNILDDDMAGLMATPPSGLITNKAGASDTFTVELTSEPTSGVSIAISSSDPTNGGTVDPSSLSFGPDDWDSPKTVTVTGSSNTSVGDVQYFVNLLASSSDASYDGATAEVSVTNEDNPPGMVAFDMDVYAVEEADGSATIGIQRTGGTSGPLTVTFRTVDDFPDNSATAGEDYASTEVTLTWNDGATEPNEGPVSVTVFDNVDSLDSPNPESVRLTIEAAGMVPAVATLEITSDVVKDINDGIVTDDLGDNQMSVGQVIVNTCTTNGGATTPNDPDFQQLCTGIALSATSGNSVSTALREATPDDAAAVRSSGAQTSNVQVSAVDGRLGTIRGGGGSGFSASGFGMSVGELAISGNLLKSFISAFDQNNPTFMQANADQDEDAMADFGRWGAWISGRIIFGEKDFTSNQIDYDFDTAGLTFGLDYRFTDQFVAGVAVGYANTDVDLGTDEGTLDTEGITVSIYGTFFQSDKFYMGGSIGLGSNDYDQLRNVTYQLTEPGFESGLPTGAFNVDQTLGAEYDGDQFSFALNGGWDFTRGGLTFGPTFGLNYIEVDVDAYDEFLVSSNLAGNTGWAVHIDDQKYKSFQPSIGFQISNAISKSWGVFIPQAYVDVVTELEDGSTAITGQFLGDNNLNGTFTLMTDDFEETFARAGLGFGLVMKNNKSAFFMVDGDLGRDLLEAYYINAGFRWQF